MKIKISRCKGGPYLTPESREQIDKELKEKGITIEDEVKRIFKEIGIDLETELIEYY